MAVLVFEAIPAWAGLVATYLHPRFCGPSRQLVRHLQAPFMRLHLTFACAEKLTQPMHPLLGFSEQVRSLGEGSFAVVHAPLPPLLEPRPGPAARVAEHGGQLVIDECRDGAGH